MERKECLVDTLNLHALHEVLREVKTRCWSCHSTLMLSIDSLIPLLILGLYLCAYPAWKWRLTHSVERLLELLVRTIEQEAEGTATRSSVINNLGTHKLIITEVELVADTNLSCRVHQHIPQAQLAVELTEQEDLDVCTCLLLATL